MLPRLRNRLDNVYAAVVVTEVVLQYAHVLRC